MLRVERLVAGYGQLAVLHGLSLEVGDGESVAILGPNGAGKSTLLKTIAHWLPMHSGSIQWDAQETTDWDAVRTAKAGIAFVPQDNKVFPSLSVQDNLEISADLRPRGTARLAECYEQFPLLRSRAKQKAGSLSGGERQLLAVVSALLLEPRLILLDEPTSGLSPKAVGDLTEVIQGVIRTGLSVIWVVEQDPQIALDVVDRAYAMAGGQVIGTFEGAELKSPSLSRLLLGGEVEAAALGSSQPTEGPIAAFSKKSDL